MELWNLRVIGQADHRSRPLPQHREFSVAFVAENRRCGAGVGRERKDRCGDLVLCRSDRWRLSARDHRAEKG